MMVGSGLRAAIRIKHPKDQNQALHHARTQGEVVEFTLAADMDQARGLQFLEVVRHRRGGDGQCRTCFRATQRTTGLGDPFEQFKTPWVGQSLQDHGASSSAEEDRLRSARSRGFQFGFAHPDSDNCTQCHSSWPFSAPRTLGNCVSSAKPYRQTFFPRICSLLLFKSAQLNHDRQACAESRQPNLSGVRPFRTPKNCYIAPPPPQLLPQPNQTKRNKPKKPFSTHQNKGLTPHREFAWINRSFRNKLHPVNVLRLCNCPEREPA